MPYRRAWLYPVNQKLPDYVLWNRRGLGVTKSFPIKKRPRVRKFEIYSIYIPTQKNTKETNRSGLNVSPPNLYVEVPIPVPQDVTAFGDTAFKEVIS